MASGFRALGFRALDQELKREYHTTRESGIKKWIPRYSSGSDTFIPNRQGASDTSGRKTPILRTLDLKTSHPGSQTILAKLLRPDM